MMSKTSLGHQLLNEANCQPSDPATFVRAAHLLSCDL
jgi:hypothetical protein